jgi:hypothetical protein
MSSTLELLRMERRLERLLERYPREEVLARA